MEKEFVKTYDKVAGELRGNLTEEEYKELIRLEYMFMYNYKNKEEATSDNKKLWHYKILKI